MCLTNINREVVQSTIVPTAIAALALVLCAKEIRLIWRKRSKNKEETTRSTKTFQVKAKLGMIQLALLGRCV